MDSSPNLSLPYLAAAQAQKHVTHNEALRALDAVVQVGVLSRSLTAPPVSPDDGDRYLIAAAPSGDWTGHADELAAFQDGAWAFYVPKAGWLAWIADEETLVAWDGTQWCNAAGVNPTPLVGVNATADDTNRLAVKSDATLFSHDDVTPGSGDHQLKVNKASSSDTASVLFQDDFSGRAEFGLAGDDDWHVKVSPDGTNWFEALVADRNTGLVTFPNTPLRSALAGNLSLYVNTSTGNDANDGSSGTPFATVAHALDVAAALDCSIYNVMIYVTGSMTGNITLPAMLGSGAFELQGDPSTPSNVTVSGKVLAAYGTPWTVNGFKLQGGGNGLEVFNDGVINYKNIEFGAMSGAHLSLLGARAVANQTGACIISGGAIWHVLAEYGGFWNPLGQTITISAAVTFSGEFVRLFSLGIARAASMTFNNPGNVTGKRYNINQNSVCGVGGGGASYFPGTIAGTTANGGYYP